MRRTHSRYVELTRHFLSSMFEGDSSATRGQWANVAIGVVAAALPAGMLMLRELSPVPEYAGKYRMLSKLPTPDAFHAAALADQLALLVVLASIAGLAALFVWQSLFPSRRDYLALAGLPVGARQIFGARLAAVGIFALGLTVALNLLPTLIAPFEYSGRWQKNPSPWVNLEAQAGASGVECLFVFFAVVALQGLLLNALPGRWFVRASVYVQGSLFALFAMGILRCWSIKDWGEVEIARLPSFAWAPPVWFAGLHEYLLGDRDPFLTAMAGRAALATAAAIGLSAITYWVAYRRFRRLILEAPDRVPRPIRWRPVRLLARDPRQLALLEFCSAVLSRSRTHRLIWLAYAGFAAAIALNSSFLTGTLWVHNRRPSIDTLQFVVLFWPIVCSTILLPGIRHVLRMPAELPANWVFRLSESASRGHWTVAGDRFVLAYALGPLYLLAAPLAFYVLDWGVAARMLAMQLLISLTLYEALFYGWQQLPFACSYLPGKRSVVNILSSYLVVVGVLAPIVSIIVAAASRFVPMFVVFAVGLLIAWLKVRQGRRENAAQTPLLYADSAALVSDLGIREISSRMPSSSPIWPPPLPHPATSSGPHR